MVPPDFSKKTIDVLAKRAAQTCSNPGCRKPTSGPHSEDDKTVVVGQAAHICGARPTAARYDHKMTDDERALPSNGIWLCYFCAKLVDSDATKFTVNLLKDWKTQHESWVEAGCPISKPAVREIFVTGGGIGSIIEHQGSEVGLKIESAAGQIAERIEVVGQGIGEIVTSTGPGKGKVIRSIGASASESQVIVNQPVNMATALISKLAIVVCESCRNQFIARKVVEGFAGAHEPKVQIKCTNCGHLTWI